MRVQGSSINKPIIPIFSSAGKELATVKVNFAWWSENSETDYSVFSIDDIILNQWHIALVSVSLTVYDHVFLLY